MAAKRIGVIANRKRRGCRKAVQSIVEWADKAGVIPVFADGLSDLTPVDVEVYSRADIAAHCDVLVSMGGDGTMLASARAVGQSGVPLLGINIGSLGFLTQLTPRQLTHALDAVLAGDFQIEERMLLKAEVIGKQSLDDPFALNDVVVDNGPISRLIDISLTVNGEQIVTYRADGLIISTPTGSTAYALAAGGPIMHPCMEAILVVPISSFSLSTRPMILSASDRLELSIRSEHGVAGLTLDGQVTAPLIDTDRVVITRAEFSSRFIVFPDSSFYKVVKSKLHWGVSPTSK